MPVAIHGFDSDIAVGMFPETCSKCVHIFTVDAQYALSQDKMDTILHDEKLDSYLFTFGKAQRALTIFSLSFSFLRSFSKKQSSAQQESKAWLNNFGKMILDR